MKLIPILLMKRASEKKKNRAGQQGQTEVEFMLILPFFLAVVFALLTFVMLVFKGQMLTYATYMAGRVAAVKHPMFSARSDAEKEARQILPGVNVSIGYGSALFPAPFMAMPVQGGLMTVTGSYPFNPLSRALKPGSKLDYGPGISSATTISAKLEMHHFQSPQLGFSAMCNTVQDDNCYTQF